MVKNYFTIFLLLLVFSSAVFLSGCYRIRSSSGGGQDAKFSGERVLKPSDIALPAGYTIVPIASGLTFPTAVTEDDKGNVFVIEGGYAYGENWELPRLLQITAQGTVKTVATGEMNGPWTGVTFHDGNFYIAEGGELKGGKILRVSPEGNMTPLIENLPSLGDHHTNGPVIGSDGYLYFSQGTATNSAVVGPDNADFGWLYRYPDFHDIPCRDIVLTGRNYKSLNPLTKDIPKDMVTTGAYVPFGTSTTDGQTIKGQVPCTGAVFRMKLTGGEPEVVAWGFRNPFGMAFSPDGQLYITENSFDVRGSRPVWGPGDYLYKVETGKWYGWPDFAGGHALNTQRFEVPGESPPDRLLKEHPNEPPHPAAILGVHSSSNGLDFSDTDDFGYKGEAFVAQFGDMAPNVGKVLNPVGYKVVRVNVDKGIIEDFAVNKGDDNGPASKLNTGGLERPVSVAFSADGKSLYVTDFGVMLMNEDGAAPIKRTGVVWKITREQPKP